MRIPTLLALTLLIIAIILGALIYLYNDRLTQKAKAIIKPENITVLNITTSSVSVIWETKTPTTGQIAYGPNSSLGNLNLDDRDQAGSQPHQIHFVTIKNLSENTNYYFKVRSGLYFFPDQPSTFKTAKKSTDQSKQPPDLNSPIIGQVLDPEFKPVDEALVFLKLTGAQDLVSFTSVAGNFLLPLSDIKDQNLSSNFTIPPKTEAQLIVKRGNLQSEAKVIIPTSLVLPAIVLGQNIDLTDIKTPPTPQGKKYDLNGDNIINSLDLAIMLDNLGQNPKLVQADLNSDGVVDQKDVDLLKNSIRE